MATVSEEVLVRIQADIADLKRNLTAAGGQVSDFGKKSESALGRLSTAATQAKAAILLVVGSSIARDMVGTITTFERLEASLRTVTGSADKAKLAFNSLQNFAMTTPFQLEEVVGAFTKLKALGLDPSIEALTSYGNTASAMGRSLNQVMEAVADAATGEFERLKEFGIRARQESDGVVFTFQGVSTKVGKNAHEIEQYLQSIGNVQFAGAMDEQSNTLNVSLSNLKDSWNKLVKAFGDAGATKAIKGVVDGLSSIAQKAAAGVDTFSRWAKEITLEKTNRQVDSLREATEKLSAAIQNNQIPWYDGIIGFGAETRLKAMNEQLKQLVDQQATLKSGLAAPTTTEDPTAPGGSPSGGGASWGGDDAAKKAAAEAERLKEQLATKLETIQESMMSEAELRDKQFEEDQQALEQALEQKLLTQEQYLQTSNDLSAQYEKEKAEERAKIEEDSNRLITNMRASLNSNLIGLLNELGSKNKAIKLAALVFEKAIAIQQAIINTHLAATAALAMDPTGVLAARVTALGYANVAAIAATGLVQAAGMMSSDSGDSGSTGSVSVSGNSNPLDGTSAASVSSTVNREATIVIQGNNFSAEQVDDLIAKMSERMGDGARFTTIRVSN